MMKYVLFSISHVKHEWYLYCDTQSMYFDFCTCFSDSLISTWSRMEYMYAIKICLTRGTPDVLFKFECQDVFYKVVQGDD